MLDEKIKLHTYVDKAQVKSTRLWIKKETWKYMTHINLKSNCGVDVINKIIKLEYFNAFAN